jgi:hypothetical protein
MPNKSFKKTIIPHAFKMLLIPPHPLIDKAKIKGKGMGKKTNIIMANVSISTRAMETH